MARVSCRRQGNTIEQSRALRLLLVQRVSGLRAADRRESRPLLGANHDLARTPRRCIIGVGGSYCGF